MKFKGNVTNHVFETSEYLCSFVNEFTGEIKPQQKVLDKRIRKHWARSDVNFTGMTYRVAITKTTLLDKIPESVLLKLAETSSLEDYRQFLSNAESEKEVTAHVQVLNAESALIAENFAERKSNEDFRYCAEAAINAALDRCLIDLGFIVPEEIEKAPVNTPVNENKSQEKTGKPSAKTAHPTESAMAISTIQDIVDAEDTTNATESSVPKASFDSSTPVEEILKHLSRADARAYIFTYGKHKGKTVGEVYEATKDRKGFSPDLKWFGEHAGKDNILSAACRIINK